MSERKGCMTYFFRLGIQINFFSERVVKQWHRQSREVVESLSPEVFKNCVDVALRDEVSGHTGDGLMVILEVFSNLNDSVIMKTCIQRQLLPEKLQSK